MVRTRSYDYINDEFTVTKIKRIEELLRNSVENWQEIVWRVLFFCDRLQHTFGTPEDECALDDYDYGQEIYRDADMVERGESNGAIYGQRR